MKAGKSQSHRGPFSSSEIESIYYLPDGDTPNVIILRALYTPSLKKTKNLKTNHEMNGIFIPLTVGKIGSQTSKVTHARLYH